MKMVIDDTVIMNGKLNRYMRILISWDVCRAARQMILNVLKEH